MLVSTQKVAALLKARARVYSERAVIYAAESSVDGSKIVNELAETAKANALSDAARMFEDMDNGRAT